MEDILVFINSHPLMKERLALKGGTAINLTVFNLPRLSVDIDLDYSIRCHVLPLVHRNIVYNGILEKNSVLAVAGIELFGSKIKALLDRAAARDLYDVSNMVKFGLFDSAEEDLLRKCALFYMAVGNDEVPETIDINKIDEITFHKIHTDLLPVKRQVEEFDLMKEKETLKMYLSDLMRPTESEKQFMEEFRQKRYRPELLFEDEEMVERLINHPMAFWKTQQ